MNKSLFTRALLGLMILSALVFVFNKFSKSSDSNITSEREIPSQTEFLYDTNKANQLIIQYLNKNLSKNILPDKIEVKQGLSIDNKIENLKYEYGTYFKNNEDAISANFHYLEDSNIPNDYSIFIQTKNEQVVTNALANNLLSKYFINPYQITDCNKKDKITYCEKFKETSSGKMGYGVVQHENTNIFINCYVPKESKDYSNSKSCIRL